MNIIRLGELPYKVRNAIENGDSDIEEEIFYIETVGERKTRGFIEYTDIFFFQKDNKTYAHCKKSRDNGKEYNNIYITEVIKEEIFIDDIKQDFCVPQLITIYKYI